MTRVLRPFYVAALAATLIAALPHAMASLEEPRAKALSAELSQLIAEATAVVGALQADINGGKAGDKARVESLLAAFHERYTKAAGKPLDDKSEGVEGDARRAFAAALKDTFTRYQGTMAKGGQDAFVPAFFRAELLKRFNTQMKGKVQAYATMRSTELINADWSVDKVMKGSPLAAEVSGLLSTGSLSPVAKRVGDRYMTYTPMKLSAGCVQCHARNGLQQKEGEFGGALVVEAWTK